MADPDNESFDFVDINPGMSGLAFAAEAVGGVCIGVHCVKVGSIEAYEDFFGRGSARPPETHGKLVLVNLPFSMFTSAASGDPAVSELISLAVKSSKGVPAVLFRVSWLAAERLGVDPEEYRATIEQAFGSDNWEVASVVSDDGNDLFVAVIARKRWNGDVPLPSSFPASLKPPKRSNPQEILLGFGYPENFALRNADVDRKLLEGIVSVNNARAAVAGTIGSVR
jgi:hypothetical protein